MGFPDIMMYCGCYERPDGTVESRNAFYNYVFIFLFVVIRGGASPHYSQAFLRWNLVTGFCW